MEDWLNAAGEENGNVVRDTRLLLGPAQTPRGLAWGSEQDLRRERPATNRLSHGISFCVRTLVVMSGESHKEERIEICK
jgi:hypothetical protein